MRARDFILKEYSREKTATVFGNKILLALQNDKSHALGGTALGTARAYLQQKAKINDPIEDSNKTIIINDIMQSLENADPTANKEYMQWIAKVYANQGIKMEDLLARGRYALDVYHTYKQKKILPPEYRDIGRIDFNTLEGLAQNVDLRQALSDKIEQDAAKTMPKGDSEVVYENSQVRIIHPKDQEAACYYGQGTRWCTAATGGNNYFDSYNRGGPMYILLPKQPKYEGEKYQLHFESGQYMDETDSQVDSVVDLLKLRFGSDVAEFFMRVEPKLKDWLVFTPDEVLEPLIAKITLAVEQYVSEIVNEWEAEDEYWWEHLRDQGYVYPEGHEEEGGIDWDAVADADESYASWNYDAADFIRRIVGAVDLSPSEVKELAAEVGSEWGADNQEIDDLDKILAYAIEQTNNRNQSDGGVAEWISDHLYLKKRDDQWDVSLLYTQKDGKRVEYPIN
jgi:hypothetical protein